MNTTKSKLEASDVDQYLTTLLASQIVLWTMDKLKDSPFYKQAVKHSCNNTIKAIEQHILPDVALVTGINDNDLYRYLDDVTKLIKKAASLSPQYISIVLEVIEKVERDPDEVLKFFQIQLIDEPCG